MRSNSTLGKLAGLIVGPILAIPAMVTELQQLPFIAKDEEGKFNLSHLVLGPFTSAMAFPIGILQGLIYGPIIGFKVGAGGIDKLFTDLPKILFCIKIADEVDEKLENLQKTICELQGTLIFPNINKKEFEKKLQKADKDIQELNYYKQLKDGYIERFYDYKIMTGEAAQTLNNNNFDEQLKELQIKFSALPPETNNTHPNSYAVISANQQAGQLPANSPPYYAPSYQKLNAQNNSPAFTFKKNFVDACINPTDKLPSYNEVITPNNRHASKLPPSYAVAVQSNRNPFNFFCATVQHIVKDVINEFEDIGSEIKKAFK